MKYYKLLMDSNGENDIICHYENSYGIQQYDLQIGKPYNNWTGNFEFYYDAEEGRNPTDYLANSMGWFVASERLKKVIEFLNVKAQYFPVKIVEKQSREALDNYYIINILQLVDALCLSESDYFETVTKKLGSIFTISKYAVYGSKLDGIDIFKLPNRQKIPIFVSQRYKEVIEGNRMTGMDFLEIKVVNE